MARENFDAAVYRSVQPQLETLARVDRNLAIELERLILERNPAERALGAPRSAPAQLRFAVRTSPGHELLAHRLHRLRGDGEVAGGAARQVLQLAACDPIRPTFGRALRDLVAVVPDRVDRIAECTQAPCCPRILDAVAERPVGMRLVFGAHSADGMSNSVALVKLVYGHSNRPSRRLPPAPPWCHPSNDAIARSARVWQQTRDGA